MGGGGSIYDRNTTDGYTKTPAGFSKAAEQLMSLSRVDPGVLPSGRRIKSNAKSPIAYAFDDTASMGSLPLIIVDKAPLVVGQIVENGYLDGPEISVAAVGDATRDSAPIQVGDFTKLRNADDWMKRLWLEGGGGGNQVEGYEHMAYFYARYCDIPKAETPFCLFTADEGMRDALYPTDLERIFGGKHERISAVDVFKELLEKFKGNVFLIHRFYEQGDEEALRGWKKCIGGERIAYLGSDLSIADVTLGIFAVVTGARTLEEYLNDMKTKRDKAQTDERVAEVRKALGPIAEFAKARPMVRARKKSSIKTDEPKTPPKVKRPGRI